MSENKENSTVEFEEVTTTSGSGNELKEGFSAFFQGKNKIITLVVVGAIVVVLGYLGYQKFIVQPKNIESAEKIFMEESYIVDTQDWEKAINGDETGVKGLAAQAKALDGYAGGELAYYNLGIAQMNLGQYEEAIKAFKNVGFNDENLATITYGAMGDSYMELQNLKEAINFYEQAYKRRPKNEMTAPLYMMKLAGALEVDGKFDQAAALYWDLIQQFPNSTYKSQAEKYYIFASEKVAILSL
jgi:tetratricopeptide (TPR) repeat protein